jgi:hypothetical protein
MSHEIIRHLQALILNGMAQSWPELLRQTALPG